MVQLRQIEIARLRAEARVLAEAAALAWLASIALPAVATLAPFQLAWPARLRVDVAVRASDLALNVLLFAPFGFALGLRARRRSSRPRLSPAVRAFALGAGLSGLLELAQLFVPLRCPSPIDVLCNAVGASLGACAHARYGAQAERAWLACLRQPPRLHAVVALALLIGAVALAPLAPLALSGGHGDFRWTLGLSPLARGPQAIVIGTLASLGIAAWLGFALRLHVRSAAAASGLALPLVAAIELCRGYSALHAASLSMLALAALCALVCAHAAGRAVALAGALAWRPKASRGSLQPARGVWV